MRMCVYLCVLDLRLRLRHFHPHLEICEARENASARCAQEKANFPFFMRLRHFIFTLVVIALVSESTLAFGPLV